jgi:chemotaxis protein methyltransferase WspC
MSARDPQRSAEAVLAARIGLDPQTVGAGAIRRALHARMSALGLHDRDAYLQHLARSEDEQQELVEEVVVPESWFFRDEGPFVMLRELVAARCDRDRSAPAPGPPIRVLSVPCGCGEESYSIAITLLDLGLTSQRFHIDAVDVSARHLAAAQRGVYRRNAFRGADLAFRDRHFHQGAPLQSFTLDPAVRGTVRFLRGNLLDPLLLSGQAPYDVIFCRNVLIYLDAPARRRALATLHRLLQPGGILFVGHAERLAIDDPGFESHGERAGFALRRVNPGVRRTPAALPALGPITIAPPRRFELTRTAARCDRDPSAPVPLPESSALLLAEAAALADQGRNDEAAARCEAALSRFGPSAPAFFLLGLVRQSSAQLAEAETCFRKTVYLDPAHDEALFALALIAERRGDTSTAARYRRRADRARAKKEKP